MPLFLMGFSLSLSQGCTQGCTAPSRATVLHGNALGTFYTVNISQLPDEVTSEEIQDVVDSTLDRINRLMSTYLDDSELSRFNTHESHTPFQLSPETYTVFEIAQRVSAQSDGAFDVTVGPLVNVWGFGPEAFTKVPDDAAIQKLKEAVGYEKLSLLPDHKISKSQATLYCDLSGIAKGYAVDAIAEALTALGLKHFMIEVGGEIRVSGENSQGQDWNLGIETPNPEGRELFIVVHLSDASLATSGDYRNMFEVEGQLVSHTIDPHTGYPVQHPVASVSVIHPSCTWADAYATALMVMGEEKALAFAKEQGLAVMLIIHDGEHKQFKERSTPQFDAYRSK
ncbi:MAG: FAD:protein FMN transferase [Candidatus Hydrogenedentes bacterium]|nr:FAD:protein FMN transferase [Candidatus Hydrogenedentota bacterium]